MPRYFFNVRDGTSHPDALGQEIATFADARRAAVKYAADVIRDECESLIAGEDWRVEMTDTSGTILFSVVAFSIDPFARE